MACAGLHVLHGMCSSAYTIDMHSLHDYWAIDTIIDHWPLRGHRHQFTPLTFNIHSGDSPTSHQSIRVQSYSTLVNSTHPLPFPTFVSRSVSISIQSPRTTRWLLVLRAAIVLHLHAVGHQASAFCWGEFYKGISLGNSSLLYLYNSEAIVLCPTACRCNTTAALKTKSHRVVPKAMCFKLCSCASLEFEANGYFYR